VKVTVFPRGKKEGRHHVLKEKVPSLVSITSRRIFDKILPRDIGSGHGEPQDLAYENKIG